MSSSLEEDQTPGSVSLSLLPPPPPSSSLCNGATAQQTLPVTFVDISRTVRTFQRGKEDLAHRDVIIYLDIYSCDEGQRRPSSCAGPTSSLYKFRQHLHDDHQLSEGVEDLAHRSVSIYQDISRHQDVNMDREVHPLAPAHRAHPVTIRALGPRTWEGATQDRHGPMEGGGKDGDGVRNWATALTHTHTRTHTSTIGSTGSQRVLWSGKKKLIFKGPYLHPHQDESSVPRHVRSNINTEYGRRNKRNEEERYSAG